MRPTWIHALSLLCLAAFVPSALGGIAPSNDDFADRLVLSGAVVEHSGSITDATLEAGERPETGFRTVWYEWTAPANGWLFSRAFVQGPFRCRLTVFTGTGLNDLRIATAGTGTGVFPFGIHVVAGTTYLIAFGGDSSASHGEYQLKIDLDTSSEKAAALNTLNLAGGATGANDDFEDRVTLSGNHVSGIGYRLDATREAEEALSNGEQTLWWSWTAPADGLTNFSIRLSRVSGKRVNLYTGDSIDSLTPVHFQAFSNESDSDFDIFTTAGETYQIAVGDAREDRRYFYFQTVLTINHTNPIPKARFLIPRGMEMLGKKRRMEGRVVNPIFASSLACRVRGNGRCRNFSYNQDTGYFSWQHRRKSLRSGPPHVIYTIVAFLDGEPNGIWRKRFPVRVRGKHKRSS